MKKILVFTDEYETLRHNPMPDVASSVSM